MAGQAAQAGGVWEELERVAKEVMEAVHEELEALMRKQARMREARAAWPKAAALLNHPAAFDAGVRVYPADGDGSIYIVCGASLRVRFGEGRLAEASDPDLVVRLAEAWEKLRQHPAWTAAEVVRKRLEDPMLARLKSHRDLYHRLLQAQAKAIVETLREAGICEA